MKILLILLFVVKFNPCVGQGIDYLAIRDSLLIQVCGPGDSTTLYQAISNFEAFDTTQITKNLDKFYEDLALRYWLLSADAEYAALAIVANKKALYHNPESTKALYNLAFQYFHANDCINGKHYWMLFKKYSPKKYREPKQEKAWYAKCNKEG